MEILGVLVGSDEGWIRLGGYELSAVEKEIAHRAAQGLPYAGGDSPPDPIYEIQGTIDADFIVELLLGLIDGWSWHPNGLHLQNCRISGPLSLSGASFRRQRPDRAVMPFCCENVFFEQPVDFSYATTNRITLQKCWFPEFTARGADIATGLTLDDCVVHGGDAAGQQTGGHHHGIDLDGSTIGGDFSAKRLCYSRLDCPRQLSETRARSRLGPVANAHVLIDADNLKISGGVDLSATWRNGPACPTDRRAAVLMGNFDNAEVFGDFRAIGTEFAPIQLEDTGTAGDTTQRRRKCLDLRGAQIRGDLELDYISTAGEIHLEDATLTQDVSFGGARLVNVDCDSGTSGVVIEAMGLAIGGSLHLVDRRHTGDLLISGRPTDGEPKAQERSADRDVRFTAIGQVRLARSRIEGDLDASGATICAVGQAVEGVALDLRSGELGGSLYLDARRDVGPGLFIGLVNLINMRVGGSVIFTGSWFRAPACQQMGPQRVHLQVLHERPGDEQGVAVPHDCPDEEQCASAMRDGWTELEWNYECRLNQELHDWEQRCRSDPFPTAARPKSACESYALAAGKPRQHMRDLLKSFGILDALNLSRMDLWRLRGGCRAIAMVDAQIAGSVLFGIGSIAKVAEYKRYGGAPAGQAARNREGPSVVVGCVDLDRIRVTGNLRLTGGIFRAVTPVLHGSTESSSDTWEGTRGESADSPPDVSMSYPSTPGWTELKARVCLSMRSAQIEGRVDTKFFGPLPVYDFDFRYDERPSSSTTGTSENGEEKDQLSPRDKKRLLCIRRHLNIVPDIPEIAGWLKAGGSRRHANTPANYVDEMVWMLHFAGKAESGDDHALGASLPSLPSIHNLDGWYPLRPDGLFDLSGAKIAAIHDHPSHGWPTSDGHLEMNGCTYTFITLTHEPSSRFDPIRQPGSQSDGGQNASGSATCSPGCSPESCPVGALKPDIALPDGPEERLGASLLRYLMRWCYWRAHLGVLWVCLLFAALPFWACRTVTWIGLAPRGLPVCKTLFPYADELSERLEKARYQEYSVASFQIRSDDAQPPAARRIKWLEQQYPGAGPDKQDFRPQPYEQLAGVMRATGYALDADSIAAAKRSMRWRAGVFGLVQRRLDWFLWITCNYTYSPARIAIWLLVVVLFTVLISGTAYDRGMLTAENDTGFSPWLYAGDVILPIIEFGYVDQWEVGQARGSPGNSQCRLPSHIQGDNLTGRFMQSVGDTIFDGLGIESRRKLQWVFVILTGFGSLLTALAVITFTGVMRRD